MEKKTSMLLGAVTGMLAGMPIPDFGGKSGSYRAPWYEQPLSKAERKGKTIEEIQALRKAKWEAKQKAVDQVN